MISVFKRSALFLIRLYQAASFKPRCRFWPSCSEYAYQTIETHGLLKGAGRALRRLLRCHPLGGHGYDPVKS